MPALRRWTVLQWWMETGMRMFLHKHVRVLVFAAVLISSPALEPSSFVGPDLVWSETWPGPGVFSVRLLSDYEVSLLHTPFDAPVFVLGASEKGSGALADSLSDGTRHVEGPSVAVLAGAHANEPAAVLAAYWLVERCRVEGGTLVVVPRANIPAAHWSGTPDGAPLTLTLGGRSLRYGARFTDPVLESLPDPLWHVPPATALSGKSLVLPGFEARNLNRVYSGDPTGSMTARTAWAITSMLSSPGVIGAIDLHEAGRKSGLAYTLITRSEFMDVAVATALDLEIRYDLTFRLERSDSSHAGYSHWEWGSMGVPSFLVETYNPAQDPATDSQDMLELATQQLAARVFAQLCALDGLVRHMAETSGQMMRLEGLPSCVDEVQTWLNGSIL
ncbi:MAG: hypothetical protein WHT81_02925 [Rectinemataceae bacterium]|nr:succinylglutamate desuccinylase/aspartoacylase family protein [Spirochaetaceae bacterium]